MAPPRAASSPAGSSDAAEMRQFSRTPPQATHIAELPATPLTPGLTPSHKAKNPWMLKLVEKAVDERLQQLMPKLEELVRQAAAAAAASPLPSSPAGSVSKVNFMVPPSPTSGEHHFYLDGGVARVECQLEAVQREMHALRASFARSSHEVDMLRSRMQEVDNMAIEWEGQMAEIREEMHGFKMHASKRLRQVSQTFSDSCHATDGCEEAETLHCRLHDACAALIASQEADKLHAEAAEEDKMTQIVSFNPHGATGLLQDLPSPVVITGAITEEETKERKQEADHAKNKWRRATAAALLQQAVRSPAARLQQKVRRSAAGKRAEPAAPPVEAAVIPGAAEGGVAKKKSSLRVINGDGEQKEQLAVRRPFFTDELSIEIESSTVTLFSCNTSCVTSPVNVTSTWSQRSSDLE